MLVFIRLVYILKNDTRLEYYYYIFLLLYDNLYQKIINIFFS